MRLNYIAVVEGCDLNSRIARLRLLQSKLVAPSPADQAMKVVSLPLAG